MRALEHGGEEQLALELLYSCELMPEKILNLSVGAARDLLSRSDVSALPTVTRERLEQKLKESSQDFIFSSKLRQRGVRGMEDILKQSLEDDFVDELRSVRILKSRSEYTILPTPLRLDANPAYTGKGICIGFLDGGFYPHPDIMRPSRRVVAYKDLGSPNAPKSNFEKPDGHSWHGMQTCVSAVGNGWLSEGLYKGIAYESNVALLKVMGDYGFTTEAIVAGIEWCIRKKKRYNLRILNISLGAGDETASFRESVINHAAEEAVQAGINVVVAAGNESWMRVTPPGNSPSVITVGGLDDRNSLQADKHHMYHSSFGITADGILKPEIIAPGIWVAAPILPGTDFYREAELVWALAHASSNAHMDSLLADFAWPVSFKQQLEGMRDFQERLDFMKHKSMEFKLIHPHYQHVDGTSFSAPIVCSIIAQMLEANPDLSPENVKEILMVSAKRLESVPVEQQGCGVVQAQAAVKMAEKKVTSHGFSYPDVKDNQVRLNYQGQAASVEVLGTFNDWKKGSNPMQEKETGIWETELKLKAPGSHAYKFLIDGTRWTDDPGNIHKAYDGFGGFNSQFVVHGTPQLRKDLKKIEEKLDQIESVKFQSNEHRKALLELDTIMGSPGMNHSPSMMEFYERRMKRVLKLLKERPVENGVFIHQLYNGGVILQTPKLNIGVDVVSGLHVWDLYWRVQENLFPELTDLLDICFVTHRLPDHLDLDIVNRLISKDKLVIVPSGMENLCLNGVIGFDAWENRELYSLGPYDMSIFIEALPGRYRHPSAMDVDLRSFRFAIAEKLNILYLAETDLRTALKVMGRVGESERKTHLLLTPLPATNDEEELKLFEAVVDVVQPDVILPTCIWELGNKDETTRGSYGRAWDILKRTGRPFETLTWGDSIQVGFQTPEAGKKP